MPETQPLDECPNTSDFVIFGRNQTKRVAILFNPRCKQWACPYCAELNKSYWVHQAARGSILLTMEGATLQFVTLTSRGYTTPTTSVYFMRTNWPKLRKRAERLTTAWHPWTGINWAYFLVPERHKSGRLHAHLVAATHLNGERWWKDNAHASGWGYITDVQEMINPLKVANYIAKYLHKDAGGLDWPPGFRRVRHSQNWPIMTEQTMPGWTWDRYSDDTAWLEKNALVNLGWCVLDKT